ncbi:hypothetical protein MRX96_048086 [Rhipicephalus microplus]
MEEADAKCCTNAFPIQSCPEEAKATEGKSTAYAQVKPQRVAPKKRKPPRERALPVPRLNHKEVSDPVDVPHTASDVVEMLPGSSEKVSQETSTDNREVNSQGVEALNLPRGSESHRRERALPTPRLNHKEVSDPADVPHTASRRSGNASWAI